MDIAPVLAPFRRAPAPPSPPAIAVSPARLRVSRLALWLHPPVMSMVVAVLITATTASRARLVVAELPSTSVRGYWSACRSLCGRGWNWLAHSHAYVVLEVVRIEAPGKVAGPLRGARLRGALAAQPSRWAARPACSI
jgi:hypothetical protein